MNTQSIEERILSTLSIKSNLKQAVYGNTLNSFNVMKRSLKETGHEFNKELKGVSEKVKLEFTDQGEFIAQMKVAGDMLIYSMHSNIFQFDRNHKVWELDYLKKDPLNGYCGIINIYNFLNDSFKYRRTEDLGYLIARVFINKNNHFFVEGKRQMGYHFRTFGKDVINDVTVKNILAKTMNYALEFDLLVPPYDAVKLASVGQMTEKMHLSQMKTGKRLGFQFNSDDVLEDEETT